jgi:hypothetical protein
MKNETFKKAYDLKSHINAFKKKSDILGKMLKEPDIESNDTHILLKIASNDYDGYIYEREAFELLKNWSDKKLAEYQKEFDEL